MSDYNDVPLVATGDWIDASWINTYIGDNLRSLVPYSATGDLGFWDNAAKKLQRVALGASNTVLSVVAGALAYQTLAQLVTAAPTAVALPMCMTARTGPRTISNATHTNGGIQTTVHNKGGFIVANDEIEIPTGMGGLYLMMGHCNWEVNENGIRQMSVGGQVVDTRWGQPGVAVTGSGWAIGSLSAGNKVTLAVWQNSGITLWLNQARILLVRLAAS